MSFVTLEKGSLVRHPNKEINAAVQYAISQGWKVQLTKGHAWGRMYCPNHTQAGCQESIWSTPRKPENHARHIRKSVDTCACKKVEKGEK